MLQETRKLFTTEIRIMNENILLKLSLALTVLYIIGTAYLEFKAL